MTVREKFVSIVLELRWVVEHLTFGLSLSAHDSLYVVVRKVVHICEWNKVVELHTELYSSFSNSTTLFILTLYLSISVFTFFVPLSPPTHRSLRWELVFGHSKISFSTLICSLWLVWTSSMVFLTWMWWRVSFLKEILKNIVFTFLILNISFFNKKRRKKRGKKWEKNQGKCHPIVKTVYRYKYRCVVV